MRLCHSGFTVYMVEFARAKTKCVSKEEINLLVHKVKAYTIIIFYCTIRTRPLNKKNTTPLTLDLGHVQVHTGAQRFATVFGLNDMFTGNSVQRCATGFEIRFLLFGGCVKNVSPISSNMCINHAVLKRQLAQWVQVKSFTTVSAAAPVYTTIEDIKGHVWRKSFIVT